MAWDTGTVVSNDPTGYICDRIKNNLGIGSEPLRNWSFVENIPAGAITPEKVRLTLSDWGTGDSFRVTFNGYETGDISYALDISSALQSALNAIAPFSDPNSNVSVTRIDVNNYDIQGTTSSKWYGVSFSVEGTLGVTNAVGCSGSFAVVQSPVMATDSTSLSVDVFKCAGSGPDANDAGCDFYVLLARDTSTTGTVLRATVAMEYSTTFRKARRCIGYRAGAATGTYEAVDANGWPASSPHNSYWATMSNIFLSNPYASRYLFTLNKTGFVYQIKMTKNFVYFAFRVGTTDAGAYLGLFDSLVVGADTYPVAAISSQGLDGGGAAYGAFLNLPGVGPIGTGVSGSFGCSLTAWTRAADLNVSNATNAQDKWASGGIWVGRGFLYHSVSYSNYYLWGGARGLLKPEVLVFPAGGTVNLGDTLTIDGATWVVMSKLTATHYAVVQPN